MTPDLDEIRRALAVDRTALTIEAHDAHYAIRRNAPTWLAALCTEVERLRELSAQLQVEQDAALDEVKRLRTEADPFNRLVGGIIAERNAALAEIERVTALDRMALDERDAWRAKYEALAAEVGRAPESI